MDIQIYGDRVRTARVLRGWKSVDLAAALRWPPSRQTTIEQSETVDLNHWSLSTLVRELKFPETFFMTRPSVSLKPDELLSVPPLLLRNGRRPIWQSLRAPSAKFCFGSIHIIGSRRLSFPP